MHYPLYYPRKKSANCFFLGFIRIFVRAPSVCWGPFLLRFPGNHITNNSPLKSAASIFSLNARFQREMLVLHFILMRKWIFCVFRTIMENEGSGENTDDLLSAGQKPLRFPFHTYPVSTVVQTAVTLYLFSSQRCMRGLMFMGLYLCHCPMITVRFCWTP